MFLEELRPDIPPNTTFALNTLDGGQNSQNLSVASVTADVTIQYTVGLATGVPTTFISVGSTNQDGALNGFLDIINFLLRQTNPPHVLTTSFGLNEANISPKLAMYVINWKHVLNFVHC